MPIRVLEKHVAELIAAGEVVERPSSVIKELIENSIDAHATQITVEIKRGGVTYMRITDNGCGIPFDEVPVAFKRHATSKVYSEDDLVEIGTLGFRGEALASVCAVARVDMLTAQTDGEGTSYSIYGGDEVKYEEAGCPKGTTIIVRDLFYNTPARMKFLKKDSSEATSVAGVVDRLALSHPEIAFRFINDGKVSMSTQGGGDLKAAVYSVYGRDFASGLIPIDYSIGNNRVRGLISKPSAARKSRSMQHFFINGRYVISKTMRAAIEQAFRGSIMVGMFPTCVLFLEMNADGVDINIHPAKLECRFTNEKPIFDVVYYGVKTALRLGDTGNELKLERKSNVTAPAVNYPQGTQIKLHAQNPEHNAIRNDADSSQRTYNDTVPSSMTGTEKSYIKKIESVNVDPVGSYGHVDSASQRNVYLPLCQDSQSRANYRNLDIIVDDEPVTVIKTQDKPSAISQPSNAESKAFETVGQTDADLESEKTATANTDCTSDSAENEVDIKLIGEAFSTYVLVESGNDLIIIDKHAAHERMIYERLKESRNISSQILLEPAAVTLAKDEYAAVIDNLDKITPLGFEIEEFGGSCVLVRAVPAVLTDCDVDATIVEIAEGFIEHKSTVELDSLDWLYHNMACRAAVKGGDVSGKEDLTVIAKRVATDDNIRYCPHGRPVAYKLTRKELEKQFGRQG